jgi:hypothetical protein
MAATIIALVLAAWVAPLATDAPANKRRVASLDKVICLKTPQTGSLVRKSRLCKTRREWDRSAQINQAEWGELQGIKGSTREDAPTWSGGSPP